MKGDYIHELEQIPNLLRVAASRDRVRAHQRTGCPDIPHLDTGTKAADKDIRRRRRTFDNAVNADLSCMNYYEHSRNK